MVCLSTVRSRINLWRKVTLYSRGEIERFYLLLYSMTYRTFLLLRRYSINHQGWTTSLYKLYIKQVVHTKQDVIILMLTNIYVVLKNKHASLIPSTIHVVKVCQNKNFVFSHRRFCVIIRFFHPATTANDLRLWRISIPYFIHFWERARISLFNVEC